MTKKANLIKISIRREESLEEKSKEYNREEEFQNMLKQIENNNVLKKDPKYEKLKYIKNPTNQQYNIIKIIYGRIKQNN